MLDCFDCGEPVFNDLIRKDIQDSSTVGYLFLDINKSIAIAYASVMCSGMIEETEYEDGLLSCSIEQTQFKLTPAIEIKYFAVHNDYRHLLFEEFGPSEETLSYMIFANIQKRIIEISREIIGANVIILYARFESTRFYSRFGYSTFEQQMRRQSQDFTDKCRAMFLRIS